MSADAIKYCKCSLGHLLDLVQVICPSVINIMEEACSYHGHHLQVGVVSLQHSCLSTQTMHNIYRVAHCDMSCIKMEILKRAKWRLLKYR